MLLVYLIKMPLVAALQRHWLTFEILDIEKLNNKNKKLSALCRLDQRLQTLMKCCIMQLMWHFIWTFTVCKDTSKQRIK